MNLKMFERSPEQEKIEKRRLVCILLSQQIIFKHFSLEAICLVV